MNILTFILFLSIISGNSKILIISSLALIILYKLYSQIIRKKILHVNLNFLQNNKVFLIFFLLGLLLMPIENIEKFFLVFIFNISAYFLIDSLFKNNDFILIINRLLLIIMLGDLIELSGLASQSIAFFRDLVGFEPLSNIEREFNLGILTYRYFGWFAEPSYHGVFVGLLSGMLWCFGSKERAAFYASSFFILCPTPMMFASGFFTLFLFKYHKKFNLKVIISYIFIISLLAIISQIIFSDRIMSLVDGINAVLNGDITNTSETDRLVYPFISLINHLYLFGFLPNSIYCILTNECLPSAFSFTIITYYIFFGIFGILSIIIFLSYIYKINKIFIIFVLSLGSILTGGSGFVLQFPMICSLYLTILKNSGKKINA